MKCSVFIATSGDGYIATEDDGVEWLETSGNKDVDLGDQMDMGMVEYMRSIDCMIMGRKTMEKLSSFNLPENQWPYGTIPIFVLSNTVKLPPVNLREKVEIISGDILELISKLESKGFQHAYIDGGKLITSFINHELINEMTITVAPVLLGKGKPLFGKLEKNIRMENIKTKIFKNDFFQIKYDIKYR